MTTTLIGTPDPDDEYPERVFIPYFWVEPGSAPRSTSEPIFVTTTANGWLIDGTDKDTIIADLRAQVQKQSKQIDALLDVIAALTRE